jgi:outer membrane protein OmpA-like peptidoglycan-associated protein
MSRRVAAWTLTAALALTGCAQEHAVLLPGEAGRPVGALAVINEDGSERGVLSSPDSSASLGAGGGSVKGRAVAPSTVDARYGRLIADLPPLAFTTKVGFDFGTASPASGDEAVLQQIFDEIHRRPGAQVQVIGHTDTVDTDDVNDALSQRRAEIVRDYLVSRGVPADEVRISSRGKRDLVNQTGDNVRDAENRKAEVVVR